MTQGFVTKHRDFQPPATCFNLIAVSRDKKSAPHDSCSETS